LGKWRPRAVAKTEKDRESRRTWRVKGYIGPKRERGNRAQNEKRTSRSWAAEHQKTRSKVRRVMTGLAHGGGRRGLSEEKGPKSEKKTWGQVLNADKRKRLVTRRNAGRTRPETRKQGL